MPKENNRPHTTPKIDGEPNGTEEGKYRTVPQSAAYQYSKYINMHIYIFILLEKHQNTFIFLWIVYISKHRYLYRYRICTCFANNLLFLPIYFHFMFCYSFFYRLLYIYTIDGTVYIIYKFTVW